MSKKYNVAVVGATGMVGQKMIELLFERRFPINELKLLASHRSAGNKVEAGEETYTIEELTAQSFAGVDFAFFSAGGDISKEFAPGAVEQGVTVIDNSSTFRMDEGIPLVVPEVNPAAALKHQGLVSNPNCSTIQTVMALEPLKKAAGIKRVVAATYQAVSGAGKEAVDELFSQTKAYLEGAVVPKERIPFKGALKNYQLAFNAVPHIDVFVEDGYSKEEMKMIDESRKIMDLPDLAFTVTTVRLPVVTGHSVALNVELENPLSAEEARQVLKEAAGVVVIDDPANFAYPMPLDAAGEDAVFVGRIRPDRSVKNGLNLWVVADNIRKGAALNSIQIAELLIK